MTTGYRYRTESKADIDVSLNVTSYMPGAIRLSNLISFLMNYLFLIIVSPSHPLFFIYSYLIYSLSLLLSHYFPSRSVNENLRLLCSLCRLLLFWLRVYWWLVGNINPPLGLIQDAIKGSIFAGELFLSTRLHHSE